MGRIKKLKENKRSNVVILIIRSLSTKIANIIVNSCQTLPFLKQEIHRKHSDLARSKNRVELRQDSGCRTLFFRVEFKDNVRVKRRIERKYWTKIKYS